MDDLPIEGREPRASPSVVELHPHLRSVYVAGAGGREIGIGSMGGAAFSLMRTLMMSAGELRNCNACGDNACV